MKKIKSITPNIKIGQKVAPYNGVVEKINLNTVDIRMPSFTKWYNNKSGVTGKDVLVRYDKSFLTKNKSFLDDFPDCELELFSKSPNDKGIYEKIL